ncbi:hypothetical protein GGQ82_003070 [Sphingobium olei]
MAHRDPRRIALVERVRDDMCKTGQLTGDPDRDDPLVQEEVLIRARASGKTNLSRAASELVKAGLLKRHYQGYRVDHLNRGAQRQAVYTLMGRARTLMPIAAARATPTRVPRQGELFAP